MYYNSKNNVTPDINTTYKTVFEADLPISVYLPDNFEKGKKYPAVIAVHGGAWYAVTPESAPWNGGVMSHNAIYYRNQGFVGITFSYRSINITPETDAADLISDCFDALQFIKNNYDFIDTEKIIFMGDSAGGHLVLALAMRLCLSEELPLNPSLVVACNPVTDCVCEKWKYCAKTPERCEDVSPAHNIKKIASKLLLIHGTADTCVDINDSRTFFNKMKAVGNDIEMAELEGRKHAFIIYRFRDSDEEITRVHEIIDNYIF